MLEAVKHERVTEFDVLKSVFNQCSSTKKVPLLNYLKTIITKSNFGYTEALGRPELREAISSHYKYWYKQNVDPECIGVTIGASSAFVLCLLAVFDVFIIIVFLLYCY